MGRVWIGGVAVVTLVAFTLIAHCMDLRAVGTLDAHQFHITLADKSGLDRLAAEAKTWRTVSAAGMLLTGVAVFVAVHSAERRRRVEARRGFEVIR
jgi:hypothetical protein